MSLFERPHRLTSVSSVVMGLNPATLREIDDYAMWMDEVHAELAGVYGEQAMQWKVSDITYATSDNPNRFSSRITQGLFESLHDYKALLEKIDAVTTQLAEQTQLQELIETAISQDTEGGKSLRKQKRELRSLKANIIQLTRQGAELKYQLACLSQQLSHVFKAKVVRISLV
ncbi:hypothetical protein Q4I28_007750 [Leishmania naiffi]|uniref:Uncharacterized protein n=2 Tax=Viannia TaxID=37616 RepID=A0AAW2ZVP3_9TRYP